MQDLIFRKNVTTQCECGFYVTPANSSYQDAESGQIHQKNLILGDYRLEFAQPFAIRSSNCCRDDSYVTPLRAASIRARRSSCAAIATHFSDGQPNRPNATAISWTVMHHDPLLLERLRSSRDGHFHLHPVIRIVALVARNVRDLVGDIHPRNHVPKHRVAPIQ